MAFLSGRVFGNARRECFSVVVELWKLLAQPLPFVFVVTMAPDIAVLVITAYVGYSLYSLQI